MALSSELIMALLEAHPASSARVLENSPPAEAAAILARARAEVSARVLESITAQPASEILSSLAPAAAGAMVTLLPPSVAATYLRRMGAEQRDALLEAVAESSARGLRGMLEYPERSAGALLDPEVLALPDDLTVREATERVRSAAHRARYNIYVTDRKDVLIGVLNLRELLLARPTQHIGEIMNRRLLTLRAMDDQTAVVTHPGWQRVHSLPVIDARGTYLGAVRYATLRRLEAELAFERGVGAATVTALGEVFWAGVSGMLDGVAGPRHGRARTAEDT